MNMSAVKQNKTESVNKTGHKRLINIRKRKPRNNHIVVR